MKIERWYDVGCDFCGRHLSTDFARGFQPTREHAETTAKRTGFRAKDGKNICPICLEEMKEGETHDRN